MARAVSFPGFEGGGVPMRALILVAVAALGLAAEGEGEIAKPFAPLENLIGSWKGTGIPTASRLKGWPETHRWAWTFAGGRAVGMALEVEGGKTLAKGKLGYDAASKRFRLEGVDPDSKPVAFEGTLDGAGKMLTLDRVAVTGSKKPEPSERLIFRLPAEGAVRTNVWLDRKEPGSPRAKRAIEVGLTREGEAFASGGAAADLPKCIVTGGAASLNVTYEGKTYPLCCTGCRDEFNESPAKYVAKAALRGQDKPKGKAAPKGRKGSDDGSFDGLVDEPKPKG